MRVLNARELFPGRLVWLENNGFAFKKLSLTPVVILAVSRKNAFFFPFHRLPLSRYNQDLTWRCWDGKPDLDTLVEEDWSPACA